ncbi:hypothetical protein DFQ27_005963 [Actinomortierella ambigua]|uniref:Methyltransferase type 11 domain-containing protein n=1 Tax=Actinomortierella ambigua TaxID=1343610 RepID=A0A9P6PZ68_9FUNG|nr:hypothetical protein DFQ27_005963 [Actinomortierella ambigua]
MGAQQSRPQRTRSRSPSFSSAPASPGFTPTGFNGTHPSLTAEDAPPTLLLPHQQQQLQYYHLQQQQQQGQHPHLSRQYHQLHHTWSHHDPQPCSPALSAASTSDLRLTSTRTSEGGGGGGGGGGRLSAKKQFSSFLSNLKNRSSASFGSSTDPTGAGLNLSQDSLGTQTTVISDSTNTSANNSGVFNFAQLTPANCGGSATYGSIAVPHPICPKEAAKLAKKAEEDARLADLREQKQQKKTNKLREKHMKELQKLQQQQLQEQQQLQQQHRRHSLYHPLPASIDAVPSTPWTTITPLSLTSQNQQVIFTNLSTSASGVPRPGSRGSTGFPSGGGGSCEQISTLDHHPLQHRRSHSGPHLPDHSHLSPSLAMPEAGGAAAPIATVLFDRSGSSSGDDSSTKSGATVVVAPEAFDMNPLTTAAASSTLTTMTASSARSAASSPLAEATAWESTTNTAMTPPPLAPSSSSTSLQQQQQAPRAMMATTAEQYRATTPSPLPSRTATPSLSMTAEQRTSTTMANRSPVPEGSNTSVVQTPELHQQQLAQQLKQYRKSMVAQGSATTTTNTTTTAATPSVLSTSSFSSSSTGSSTATTKPTTTTTSTTTAAATTTSTCGKGSFSKFGFIRGKAGFAWLEKRIAGLSGSAQNVSLSSSPSSSVHFDDETIERRLDEMEHEAAKQYKDRVAEQHFLMKDVMGGNSHVPIDLTFKRVLENGCGAGDWTLDMASDMPETDFVGCPQIVFTTSNAGHNTKNALYRPRGLLGADQSQQGTGEGAAPPLRPRNCSFVTTVPMNRLPFHNDHFDYVFQRRQSVVLLTTEWQRTILELFRVLKKGGWVEIIEPDLCLRGGGELCQLAGEYCIGLFESLGRHPNVIHEMPILLAAAGFVNVQVKVWSMPLGWGGPVGKAMLRNQQLFVNEMEPMYVRQGHGDSREYHELTEQIFHEAVDRRAYINYHSIIAQKPVASTDRHKESKPQMSKMLA